VTEDSVIRKAGSGLFWKAAQHAGEKAIFLIRLLVLARLLAPEDFGLLAISITAVGFLSRITDFGLIPALVQRPKIEDRYYHTAWTLGIIRAFGIAVLVFLTSPLIAQLFNEPRSTLIIQALAILPVLEASASIKLAELVRNLSFRSIALVRLPGAVANTIVAVVLAPSFGVWALVAGTLAGPFTVLIVSYFIAPYGPRFSMNREVTRVLIQFGRWIFATSLLALAGNFALRLVIARQLGTAELGLYYLAASLAFLPYEVASQVVGEVTFSLYARIQANLNKVARTFKALLAAMFAVMAPSCLLLIVLAPALIETILGENWDGTLSVIQILAIACLFDLLGAVNTPTLRGLGVPSKVTLVEGIQTVCLVSLTWIFTEHWGVEGAALAWLPAILISQSIGCRIVSRLLPRPFAGLWRPLLVITGVSILAALLAAGVYTIIPGFSGLVLGICIALVTTGSILLFTYRSVDIQLSKDLMEAFPKIAVVVGQLSPAGEQNRRRDR